MLPQMSRMSPTLRRWSQPEVLHHSAGGGQVQKNLPSKKRISKNVPTHNTPLSQQLELEETGRKGKLRTATTPTSENCMF